MQIAVYPVKTHFLLYDYYQIIGVLVENYILNSTQHLVYLKSLRS